MFENVCYRRNYLTSVIARVDFLNPIKDIDKQLPPEVSKEVLKNFQIAEPRQVVGRQLQISSKLLKQKKTEFTEWRFHGKDRDKTLTIVPTAIYVAYSSYSTYEALREEFLRVLTVFFTAFEDVVCKRLGLRYINEIVFEGDDDPLSWSEYLDERMLGLLQFYPEPQRIARAFHNLELNFGDLNLRYQFGIFNPDFPAVVRQKSFILDLDAYYNGSQEYAEIAQTFDKLHDRIQEVFELSITDKLRGILNG